MRASPLQLLSTPIELSRLLCEHAIHCEHGRRRWQSCRIFLAGTTFEAIQSGPLPLSLNPSFLGSYSPASNALQPLPQRINSKIILYGGDLIFGHSSIPFIHALNLSLIDWAGSWLWRCCCKLGAWQCTWLSAFPLFSPIHCLCAEVSGIRVISIESVCLVTPPLVISLALSLSHSFSLMNSPNHQVPPFLMFPLVWREKGLNEFCQESRLQITNSVSLFSTCLHCHAQTSTLH